MKLALDHWPGATHEPGAGRYMREFARALVALPSDSLDVTLVEWGRGARVRGALASHELPAHARLRRVALPRSSLPTATRLQLGFERLAPGAELVHAVALPAAFPTPRRARLSLAVAARPAELDSLRSASVLVTFSEHARSELAHANFDPARTLVVPVGCEHFVAPRAVRGALPRVLALGRIDEDRSPLALLAALERLHDAGKPAELTFLGRLGDAYDELRARTARSRISSRVRFDSQPDDAKVRGALASHDVLVTLAREDWTPVTPLEGLACGLELVASRLSAYRDALCALPQWVEPSPSAEELASALARAIELTHAPSRASAARARAAEFGWSSNAALTLAGWRSILGLR
ncbi:MAG: glycosyltransferase [Planctomycetes bacterium]|nr:glycosyltransferase [Planctomycetota bacterium]